MLFIRGPRGNADLVGVRIQDLARGRGKYQSSQECACQQDINCIFDRFQCETSDKSNDLVGIKRFEELSERDTPEADKKIWQFLSAAVWPIKS
jgi:hypothetical protein